MDGLTDDRQATDDAVIARQSPAPGESVSMTVVRALDSIQGIDASRSDVVLADAIDPDALDALFRPVSGRPRDEGRVSFTFADYDVTVEADGAVTVRAA